ncbi:MAG: phage major capsid protein [Chloroflexota bacterium]|nr:phage major capsid protein [Chloroflexota bacterium]MDE2907579.1 phage major capsid protein [Chloroflexota bacterium]
MDEGKTIEAMMKVKMIDDSAGRVGGYLITWGEARQPDMHGEFFTPETDVGLEWYERRPVLYHHGLDGALKAAVIGVIDTLAPDEIGLWAEAQLDLHKRYVRAVRRLVDQGALSWSSGSLPHLVEVEAGGRIKRWPIVEGSLTPTPAEPRRTDVRILKSAYKALGLDMARLGLSAAAVTETQPAGEKGLSMTEETLKRLPLADEREALKLARVEVGSEFDALDALDMLHGYMLLRSAKSFRGVSERYSNALADKVQRAKLKAIKADELAYSTQTGFGDEWAPDLWSQQIWHKARQDNTILPLFQSVEMPSNPFELPIEGTDPTVYFVPETQDEAQLTLDSGNPIPDSKIGSGKVTLNAKKLALRVGFSSELVEDAVIPVLNIYREQAARAIADAIDNVLLNGDTKTGATGNINSDAARPASTAKYLALNGLRRLPLVDRTENAVNMNGAPTLAKMRQARFKMSGKYAARPSDLAWIVDSGTYAALLNISEFLTMDKAGPLATAQTGQIGYVDGIPVFVSAEMSLTEADGKVGDGTNSKGQAVCVYRPGWYVGYRRKIAVSVDYLSYYDSYQLTATVRLAFVRFDKEVASCLYNIAV